MAKYFDYFPIIPYDIAGKNITNYEAVRNIFFRLRVVRSVLSNISAYYEYLIKEGDTPEIVAEKVYKNPEAHWIILMANDMIDAAYDWPLTYDQFNKYIIKKYGSIEYAQTHYHHYEKVIQRTESLSGLTTETRFVINEDQLTNNDMTVPYDTWESLADVQYVQNYNIGYQTKNTTSTLVNSGRTVNEIIFRDRISYYDYESQLNDNKRVIKIIKPEYYPQIIREFYELTGFETTPYLRKLIV